MASINELRTLAFRYPPGLTEQPYSYKVFSFPTKWDELIGNLTDQARRRWRPQVKALKQLALALFPQLISVEDSIRKPGWLYSTAEIEQEHLRVIFSTWIRSEFSDLPKGVLNRADEQIDKEKLIWRDERSNLAETSCNAWGTATLPRNENFFLIPEALAQSLSRSGLKFDYHSQPLQFRRAPSAGKGVELISWPPYHYDEQGSRWAYSVYLRFTLQTVPFQKYPVVYCDMGLRRWVSMEKAWLGRDNHSVYLLTRLADVDAGDHTNRFQIASVRWKRQVGSDNGGSPFKLAWDDLLPELFTRIYPPDRLPDPNDMLLEPLSFMDRSLKAAIVFDGSRMDPWAHGVLPGLMPVNRSHLTRQIADHLERECGLVFDEAPKRVATFVVKKAPKNIFFEKTSQEVETAKRQTSERRSFIARMVGDTLRIELWYQSDTARETLVRNIKELFGLMRPKKSSAREGNYAWVTPELKIELRTILLGDLALPLDAARSRTEQQRSFWRRVEEVIRTVKGTDALPQDSSAPVATIVELADQYAEEYRKEGRDPKKALRIGFAQAGRLTQFITPTEEGINNRAKMSILDMLRQLGVQPALPQCSGKTSLRAPKYVAVHLIRSREGSRYFLPVMLQLSADGSELLATASGLGTFLPYSQFLLRIAERNATQLIHNDDKYKIPLLIQDWLKKIVKGQDVILLAHAQKTREGWPWLSNGRIAIDQMTFQQNEQLKSITEWPGLRVVRVRDCTDSETPESYAQKDGVESATGEDDMSFASGLFHAGTRAFHSITGKPKQQKKLSRNASKARTPNKQAWNARIVELIVACMQPRDEDWHIAQLVHRLRETAGHFDEPITLPLPLHLLEKAKEYALLETERD